MFEQNMNITWSIYDGTMVPASKTFTCTCLSFYSPTFILWIGNYITEGILFNLNIQYGGLKYTHYSQISFLPVSIKDFPAGSCEAVVVKVRNISNWDGTVQPADRQVSQHSHLFNLLTTVCSINIPYPTSHWSTLSQRPTDLSALWPTGSTLPSSVWTDLIWFRRYTN